jgi:hypothetical protein
LLKLHRLTGADQWVLVLGRCRHGATNMVPEKGRETAELKTIVNLSYHLKTPHLRRILIYTWNTECQQVPDCQAFKQT